MSHPAAIEETEMIPNLEGLCAIKDLERLLVYARLYVGVPRAGFHTLACFHILYHAPAE